MRLEKLKAELEKAWQKAAEWQARARDLEKQILEQENLQIIAAVRSITVSPEDLGAVLGRIRAMKDLPDGYAGEEKKKEDGRKENAGGGENEE